MYSLISCFDDNVQDELFMMRYVQQSISKMTTYLNNKRKEMIKHQQNINKTFSKSLSFFLNCQNQKVNLNFSFLNIVFIIIINPMHFLKRTIPKLFLISTCSYLSMKNNFFLSQQPLLQQVIRGEYENKIRRYSPPQKIFDVFATIYENGQLYMTLQDLLKAICFYNYSVSDLKQTEGYLPEAVLQLVGQKDKFQFYDYFILVRFLAFERKKILKYFQQNVKGKMKKEDFRKYLMETVCGDYNRFIKQSIGFQSRQFKPKLENFQKSINESVESVFKKHPHGLSLSDMVEFRRDIIKQLFGFQFLMFKQQEGKIDGADFARSIIKYVETSKKRKYQNRVKQLSQQFQNVKIEKESYVGFHYYIRTNMQELVRQLNTHGAVNSQEVYDLINKYTNQKMKVSKQQIDILFKILDVDDSGFIEKKEFLDVLNNVLENLQSYTQVKSGQQTFTELLQQDYNKAKQKAKKIWEILQE